MTGRPSEWPVERVIAIVGCQRSGTTLTGQIFGAHPSAVLIDEFDGVYPWFHALMEGASDNDASERLLEKAATKYGTTDDRFVATPNGKRLARDVKVLVLKTPNLTYDEERVARMPWPVTVVYPVRDPRAVVASMARLESVDFVANQIRLIAQRPSTQERYRAAFAVMADASASVWTRRAALWQIKSGRQADFERAGCSVHAFRYEDLVDDSTAVIAAMFAACGLGDPQAGLAAHLTYAGIGPGGTDRTRPIDSSSLSGQEALTSAQLADVMRAAEPLAGRLGYA
ncbi:sulfotransferase [Beijerinckia sp. L45]|uniref:sulfotransferase family protein n=1 Tax=Beijerinckia sp. L45 TaxID=1641855 RepID=UPI00131BFD13|nr:sulfotransferase [Beijerinckia sp. L45]